MPQSHLREIFDRFEIFLQKLSHRADEILSETEKCIKELYNKDSDGNNHSFLLLKNGILGQIQAIIEQAESVWQTKVVPELQSFGRDDRNDYSIRIQKEFFEHWKVEITEKSEKIFANFREKSVWEIYQEAIQNLESIPKILCQGCQREQKITKIYTRATYISCDFCKTKNIFTPSVAMRELGFHRKGVEKNGNIARGKYQIEF